MKRARNVSMETTARASKRRRVAAATGCRWDDLVDDVIGEMARYLVAPADYFCLAQTCRRNARLLAVAPLRTAMETRYFVTWRALLQPRKCGRELLQLPATCQTDELCRAIVRRDGLALQHVTRQMPDICRVAIQENPAALGWVVDQTDDMCMAAVQRNGMMLSNVRKQTIAICRAAVRQNGLALRHVARQCASVCLLAVQSNGLAIFDVRRQTDTICRAAVQQNGLALRYIDNQTEAICLLAVKQNVLAIEYVHIETAVIHCAVNRNALIR